MEHADEFNCSSAALLSLMGAIQAEVKNIGTESTQRDKNAKATSGHVRKTSIVRSKHSRGLSSSALASEEVEPELQLLRSLGVALPPEHGDSSAVNIALESALCDRVEKLSGHTMATATSIETALATHLQESSATVQQLYDALLSDTPYREVALIDKETTAMIEALSVDINKLEGSLAEVNLEKLHERDTFCDQFVDRWAR